MGKSCLISFFVLLFVFCFGWIESFVSIFHCSKYLAYMSCQDLFQAAHMVVRLLHVSTQPRNARKMLRWVVLSKALSLEASFYGIFVE